ncbi:cell division protein FtsZ [Paracoccus aestuarii]|uniref:Cell division protein FtsZ n=1 Tax=Paracoccus aestuarii TaxID=453842 RepID=A0A419A0G0_9RHOB|nr:cell division protein FtsZ [Paracoccus aestuarii]RJL06371.1 cell division protein FtsZ [Paracoccus aestuarii]WCR00152.1 cell division protein FtsZ [Paracoccus aestuarii]
MNLNLMMNDEEELKPRITVFGVGGAGGNAVNNMIQKQLDGVEFVVANTDAQALQQNRATARIQMGPKVTEGLGAGAKPTIGAKAAEETIEDIVDHLMGAHMCFITAGMGGGTGTGAAPIIAQAAREMGILTVGVVTKPFQFEGTKRMRQAEEGVEALQKVVDTLIIIPNQNLFRLANEKTTFTEAFAMADDVLYQGVKGVTDLMVRPGLINLDFADVRAVMDEMGKAMMGTGEASGENRAQEAAERAIANPLLDEISLNGARGVLINITGGYDMTLFELDEAANVIRDKVDSDANIIVGSTLDPDMDGAIRVSVVATGIDANAGVAEVPAPRRTMAAPLTQNPPVAAAAAEEPQIPARRSPAPETASLRQDAARAEDDMPQPAYQPKEAGRQTAVRIEDDASAFVAPRAPQGSRAGQPTPEVMDRLRRAVDNHGRGNAPQQPQPQQSPAQSTASRMSGLGRMLERMAGHGGDQSSAQKPAASSIAERVSERVAVRARQQDTDFDDLASPESGKDNVEIPAFLRRQAN